MIATEIEWITFANDGQTCAIEYPSHVMKMKKSFIVFFGVEDTKIIKEMIKQNKGLKFLFPSSRTGQGHYRADHLTAGFR